MIGTAITLGLIFSLISYEVFGIAAGGIVVPGYLALQLSNPQRLISTLLISLLTLLFVKLIGKYTFLYGRRQMVISLLIGGILSSFLRELFSLSLFLTTIELRAVGWVIPGLIAHWFEKQGIVKTIMVMIITSILVRFLVIILFGGRLIEY